MKPQTYTFHTPAINGGPFRCRPAGEWTLPREHILSDNVVLPGECSPWGLWIVGNEFGPMGAVWAKAEDEALDALEDADLARGIHVEDDDASEDCVRVGNYDQPVDLTHCWFAKVAFDPVRDFAVLLVLAEARGAGVRNLGEI